MLLDVELGEAARSRGSREQRGPGSSAAGVVKGSCCCFPLAAAAAPEAGELLLSSQGLWGRQGPKAEGCKAAFVVDLLE